MPGDDFEKLIYFDFDTYRQNFPENAEVIEKAVKVLDYVLDLEEKPEIYFFMEFDSRIKYNLEAENYGLKHGWRQVAYDDLPKAKNSLESDYQTLGFTDTLKNEKAGSMNKVFINVTEHKKINIGLNDIITALSHEIFHRVQASRPEEFPDRKSPEFEQQAKDFGEIFLPRFNNCLHKGELDGIEDYETLEEIKEYFEEHDLEALEYLKGVHNYE